ncbi:MULTISPECIES: DcaP family trimeric outer membrane transporter [Sphingobium]|uniref:DcaP family trimeric outer membrane transporter n=1 Tax=Sphingobium TaxID=165695 RepID=UPI00159C7A96|nr:DcaP family trimeric outer membrane transporter [Sphingobium sp. 15-1]
MSRTNRPLLRILLGATALAASQLAHAQTSEETDLTARLARLEGEVTQLRTELAAARNQQEETATTAANAVRKSDEASAQVTKLADSTPKLGFRSGNTNVVLSGYVKLLASSARYSGGDDPSNTLGRDLYLPQSIPIFNPASPTSPTRVTDFSAKQTRFWVDATTKLGTHALKAYIEFDFQAAPGTPQALGQGTQRTTNAYDLAMRRAFIQFDRWTFGQDFTNFSNPAVFPESTDYVGGVDGLIFVRQPMVRYSMPLSHGLTLHLAAENPETASATIGAPALIENGEDHAPDMTGRLEYAGGFGFLDLAVLGRQLRVDNAKTGAAHIVDSRLGWGISTSGKIFLDDKHGSDIRFQATYGEGIGRYLGLNFGPDAVLQTNGKLAGVRNLALFGAGRYALDDQWRVNLIASYQRIFYADTLNPATTAGIAMFNRQAWSVAGNLFYSPVKNVDLGIEYRHGERRLVNDLNGHVDRFDVAAKYNF